jgi:hypothetical protein
MVLGFFLASSERVVTFSGARDAEATEKKNGASQRSPSPSRANMRKSAWVSLF